MESLEGKIAIVTGGSRGIGAAIALGLARMGAKVAITFIQTSSKTAAENIVTQINSLGNGAQAISIQADSGDTTAPAFIVEETLAAFGRNIDILVNNAGLAVRKPFLETTVTDFTDSIDINLRGPFFLSQAVVPHLRRPGRIINVSSIVSRHGGPFYGVYSASKAGLEGFTRSLAQVLGHDGHSVNAVLPGLTDTDMLQTITKDDDSAIFHKGVAAATPMEGRVAHAAEIANVVCFLANSSSQWITGQSISATGGLLML